MSRGRRGKGADGPPEASRPAIDPLGLRPAGLNEVEINVFQKLVDAVSERRLAPGMKLNEEEIGEIFSVSRERIRRILLVLSQFGIVRLEPNRGASVASPNRTERRDAFEARALLERHVIAVIAGFDVARRQAIVSELRLHILKEREAIADDDRSLQIRLSGEFHLRLAAQAGNAHVMKMLQEMVALMSLSLAAHAPLHKLDCSICEHTAILDAIEAGDGATADRLLHGHLALIEEDMAASLEDASVLHRALLGTG